MTSHKRIVLCLHLDRRHRVRSYHEVARAGIAAAQVDLQILFAAPMADLDVSREPARCVRALPWILHQAEQGKRVEIGCAGGHGRTGTTLATLLVLQGMSPKRAAQRIRRTYCHEAIETRSQMHMIHTAGWSTPPGRAKARSGDKPQLPRRASQPQTLHQFIDALLELSHTPLEPATLRPSVPLLFRRPANSRCDGTPCCGVR